MHLYTHALAFVLLVYSLTLCAMERYLAKEKNSPLDRPLFALIDDVEQKLARPGVTPQRRASIRAGIAIMRTEYDNNPTSLVKIKKKLITLSDSLEYIDALKQRRQSTSLVASIQSHPQITLIALHWLTAHMRPALIHAEPFAQYLRDQYARLSHWLAMLAGHREEKG